MKTAKGIAGAACILMVFLIVPAFGGSAAFKDNIYDPGKLKPIDSKLKINVGDLALDFTLPSVGGQKIRLSQYRGKKNVMISFVSAAWTPVCSDQWPGYNTVKEIFCENDINKRPDLAYSAVNFGKNA